MRCFIALKIPKEIFLSVKRIQDKLPDFFGKKTKLENLHLTLKFFRDIPEDKAEAIKDKLKEIAFKIFWGEIDSIGFFDNRKSKEYQRRVVVWLHIKNCEKLQKEVDKKVREVGFKEERRFMSHLTIARIKNINNKDKFLKELKKIKIPKTKFEVDGFLFIKSRLKKDGPKYDLLERYDLI